MPSSYLAKQVGREDHGMTAPGEPPEGRALLGVGDPFQVIHDEQRGLLAVAGTPAHGRATPVAIYDSRSLTRRALVRSRFPVHARADLDPVQQPSRSHKQVRARIEHLRPIDEKKPPTSH
ncbi:hypothetical protein [Streptomyces mutabilis]|uniref:hypothetical protein n=1 Tax=Streptomyces mutabilis TaxID=67332 RepID=UPI00114614C5|nr:hypothetical protein [Streptomyces mutabilis]